MVFSPGPPESWSDCPVSLSGTSAGLGRGRSDGPQTPPVNTGPGINSQSDHVGRERSGDTEYSRHRDGGDVVSG